MPVPAPLRIRASRRQLADWLYGLNMTRLYSLLGTAETAATTACSTVGRVQTPLLPRRPHRGARSRPSEQFKPVPYCAVSATMQVATGASFRARWAPGAAVEAHLDKDKRLLSKAVAERIRARTQGQPGTAIACSQDKKSEAPPLPYALADLQMDAAKRLGLSAQAVLDACQSLYETRCLITYPRSDCSHLPEGHFAQAKKVVDAVRAHAPTLARLADSADLSLRSNAWNDQKVTAHHAIIPTPNAAPAQLGDTERAVYELIGRRYLAQFYPPFETLQTTIELEVAQERFVASGRQILSPGWKAARTDGPVDAAEGERGSDSEDSASLPPLHPGDAVTATAIAIADKRTQPPKAFTDASIIQAMCHVAKFVRHPSIKKILTEADGIGTPATRAAIVETLFERDYIVRVKKTIVSTPTGRALIQSLPKVATTPDMTAVWEAGMRAITEGQQPLDAFLGRVHAELAQLVEQGKALGRITVGERHPCPGPGCPGPLRRLKGKSGFFWSCAALPHDRRRPPRKAGPIPGRPSDGARNVHGDRPGPGPRRAMMPARELSRLHLGLFAATAAAASLACILASHLIWNWTPSLPLGLYWLSRGGAPGRAALVAFPVPAHVRALVADRRYLPPRAMLIKPVVAVAGDRVCTERRTFTVNGERLGPIATEDSAGRPCLTTTSAASSPRASSTSPPITLGVLTREPSDPSTRATSEER